MTGSRSVNAASMAADARSPAETLLAGEHRLLNMIATGTPLGETLDAVCRLVEQVSPDSLTSILLVDAKADSVWHGAAPTLPGGFVSAIDGMRGRPAFGPHGLAAQGESVVASDIAADPRWSVEYRELALRHGLRACWSAPITASNGRVLGVFEIYLRQAGDPSAQQASMLGPLRHLAAIAIERAQAMPSEVGGEMLDALRRSEERYARAMEASGDGYADWTVATDEFYASPRLLEMCGLPPDAKFAGRADFVARLPVHPEDRDRVAAAVDAHYTGTASRLELDMRVLRDGETRWMHAIFLCSRDASGALRRVSTAVTDITDRKRIEEELRARQDMLDLAQKAARAVAFEWRRGAPAESRQWPESWAVRVSAELEGIFGVPPGSFDGTYESWKKLVHPEDWAAVKRSLAIAGETGDLSSEYRVVIPGAAPRWVQAKGRVLLDADGDPERLVGFVLDVTEKHKAEDELRRLESQLRLAQRLEAMGTLAGGIAHDFNNILGAILGYGEMALRDVPKGSRLRRDLDSIMTAGERGRALVDRVLAFSRSGLGERVAVDVEKVVREALDLVAAKLPEGIRVEAELRAGHAAMLGDPTQVHQVLMNLVTNAVQAMPAGGTLYVSLDAVRCEAERAATIGSVAAGEYVALGVADTGTGIPRDIIDRIFDPFFTTKEVGVGTGLGLSLVHGIVAGLGGAIDVSSVPGQGSEFTVYLPRSGDAVDPDEGEAAALPRGDGQRVLIVDDEAPLASLTARTLEELGYAPTGFTSSTAALAAFRADPARFDAVITDERMPGMTGTALIRELRGIRRGIPIVLMSGYLGADVVRHARNAGADQVLKKPVSARDLAISLARALRE